MGLTAGNFAFGTLIWLWISCNHLYFHLRWKCDCLYSFNVLYRSSNDRESCTIHFKDTASAAQAAAESAEKAVAAAQAAAYLANQSSDTKPLYFNKKYENDPHVVHSVQGLQNKTHSQSNAPNMTYASQSFGRSQYMRDEESSPTDGSENHRRHSYNVPRRDSDIKFDDSDGLESDADEEIEMETRSGGIHLPPPNRPPPSLPSSEANHSEERTATDDSRPYKQNLGSRVHPKLPDYDSLAARFDALKFRKSWAEKLKIFGGYSLLHIIFEWLGECSTFSISFVIIIFFIILNDFVQHSLLWFVFIVSVPSSL